MFALFGSTGQLSPGLVFVGHCFNSGNPDKPRMVWINRLTARWLTVHKPFPDLDTCCLPLHILSPSRAQTCKTRVLSVKPECCQYQAVLSKPSSGAPGLSACSSSQQPGAAWSSCVGFLRERQIKIHLSGTTVAVELSSCSSRAPVQSRTVAGL